MPLMSKIRDNLGKMFLTAFATAFILYIMLDWGMELTSLRPSGTGDTVGEVNGQEIKYRDFTELMRRALESQKSQTGQDPDPETERQIRSQVWNTFVNQILIEQEIDRLGITVTDRELVDLVTGPRPPDELINMFRDSTGAFNRAAYDRAISDPQNRQAWVQVEERLRQQLRQQKLQSLLLATVRVSEEEVRQRFAERNVTMEGAYVLFDPNQTVPDSMVVVTEDDIERYYRENQEEFKVRPARQLKFVLFSTSPAAQDSQDVMTELARLKEQAAGSDFMDLAETYSEIPATRAFYKLDELSREKAGAVFSASVGEIVGPVADVDGMHLIKITDSRRGKDEFVHAAHILFQSNTDSPEKLQEAREVLGRIRAGEDFSALARQYGSDATAKIGGDLGWGNRSTWVKPFSDAAFAARKGEVVGPVKTPFGYHLIKVLNRTNLELELIDLAMKVKSSGQTIDNAHEKAQDFAYLAGEEGFEHAAQNSSYQIRETSQFTEGGAIPQIGFNESVMNFAFSASLDEVSEPINVSGGVAVFKVSSVREEGVRPYEEVKDMARTMAVRQKKMEKAGERAHSLHKLLTPSADLLAAAARLGPSVTARTTGPFKASEPPPGVGRDLAFIGVAESLNEGEVSKPFEGARGYYILKLTSKAPFDSTQFASQSKDLREGLLREKRSRFSQDWVTSLREQADIEDYRDRFFR